MEQFPTFAAEQNQATVQGPPLAQHERQWAQNTALVLLQQETNAYQIFKTPKVFSECCPNYINEKRKEKSCVR